MAHRASSPIVGAFFDLDYTVLTASSGRLFVRYLRSKGLITPRQQAALAFWSGLYLLRVIDFPQLMARLIGEVIGQDEASTWDLCHRWFDEVLVRYISRDAQSAILRHREAGHHVAIVSAATPYAVGPVASYLGLENAYLATRLEVKDGHFTGRLVEPACYGPGKVHWVERYAEARGIDLERSYFYSDSATDLPLLERVGNPVAVNPDRRLRRVARRRGWPIMRFR
ncbi:MAG: HAD family hydrolase [Anaerolineae bacterium]